MKKIVLIMIIGFMGIGIISCNGKNVIFPKEDSSILPFSYQHYVAYYNYVNLPETLYYEKLKEYPSEFKNTRDKKIRNEKDVIKLAKNELKIEYNQTKIYYDKSSSMWLVAFFRVDEQNESCYSQRVCMDSDGITKFIVYSYLPPDVDFDKIQPFEYIDEGSDKDPANFKNTTETKIKTIEDVIELAKNEAVWEYKEDEIIVSYDELNSVWSVYLGLDYLYNQSIYIDSKGITKAVMYGYKYTQSDGDVISCYIDSEIENLELNGGIKRNSNEFKNTTETEATIAKKAINLAKNEVTTQYDRIFVGFDEATKIWEIIFWADEKPGVGQYVFIDSKGITQVVIDRPFVFYAYKAYVDFLEKRNGIENESDEEYNNTSGTELNSDNPREKLIELAKNELPAGYEYDRVVVYYDLRGYMYMVSFWEDSTFTKGLHIFINGNGITKLIMYTN